MLWISIWCCETKLWCCETEDEIIGEKSEGEPTTSIARTELDDDGYVYQFDVSVAITESEIDEIEGESISRSTG